MSTPAPSQPERSLEEPARAALEPTELPIGDHPVEVAARAGYGPLSPKARDVWHGGAAPCVTCGQLVPRSALTCEHCGQDLHPVMIERMRAHAGPWYVYEHVRPFPGVSLERIIRQIHRGVITETSIVRGPNTDYQWRFAVETPGLSIYFLRCWRCHADVAPTFAFCPSCHSHLYFDLPVAPSIGGESSLPPQFPPPSPVRFGGSVSSTVPGEASTPEFEALRNALSGIPDTIAPPRSDGRSGAYKSYGLIAGMVIAAMALLLSIVQLRGAASRALSPVTTPSPVR